MKDINSNVYRKIKHVAKGVNLNNVMLPDAIKTIIDLQEYVYKGK